MDQSTGQPPAGPDEPGPDHRAGGHRAVPERSFFASLGLTVLGAIIPGSGFWFAGRRLLGAITVGILVAAVGVLVALYLIDWHIYLNALDTTRLIEITIGLIVIGLAWVAIIVLTHLLLRPGRETGAQRVIGAVVVTVLCVVVAAPFAVGARYAYVTRNAINEVFKKNVRSVTTPKGVSESNPWGGQDRVNILLLGGDGGLGRIGVRTDSMVLASINTQTGDTVLFSLPRNLQNAPFPASSPLHALYPNGFNGTGDEGNWLLNAIYREVPILHPGILGKTDNEGADALKESVSTILGLPVNYYLLINLNGFVQLVDALGGITVNVDERVPIGGDLDTGKQPIGWINPGPDQHLDGFHALWFARGRFNTTDYVRMERQRCVINAVVNQANPTNVLLRYQQIAQAGARIARTDIPQSLLIPLVNLALKVKNASLRSVVFQPSAQFDPVDPNFAYMQSVVRNALNPATPTTKHSVIQNPTNVCAYHPNQG